MKKNENIDYRYDYLANLTRSSTMDVDKLLNSLRPLLSYKKLLSITLLENNELLDVENSHYTMEHVNTLIKRILNIEDNV